MAVDVIVGLQRGDEGKGRFVDMLAESYDNVARYNGGDNAGHTVVLPDGRMLKLHMVPSGIAHPGVMNVIGNGTLVNPSNLHKEIDGIQDSGIEVSRDNLKLSSAAHIIMPHHISLDEVREAGLGGQGSTKSGIAYAAADKSLREGVRVEAINNHRDELLDLVACGLRNQREQREELGLEPLPEDEIVDSFHQAIDRLGQFVTDTAFYLNQQLHAGKTVLAEGAQAFLLDGDHGMSPFTTSSSTTSGGVSPGLGIPPHAIEKVYGVIKAVQSHVGGGPFVTEVEPNNQLYHRLHGDMSAADAEQGTTTGRKRRLGFLDLPQIRRANMVNGTTEMALTKLDWIPRFGESVPICVEYVRKNRKLQISPDAAYKLNQSTPRYEVLPTWNEDIQDVRVFEDLPEAAQGYVEFIEEQTEVPITMIGVGPRRDQVIIRSKNKATD